MKPLTKRQAEVLDFIKSFRAKNSFPPTLREIADNFNISVKGVYDHLKAIEKKEYIKCNLRRSRAIEVIEKDEIEEVVNIPLLGNVAAGRPIMAEENFDGHVPVPVRYLKKGVHFALKVKGDSMQGAGIIDGDTVLFVHQNTAQNGNIVVAMLDNESVTLKRFFKEKNRIKLKAENPVYPAIYTQNATILGKLVCLLRYYD